MKITIQHEDPRGPSARPLLEAHIALMRLVSPPGSGHALDLDGLARPEISFWTARSGSETVGCVALKALSSDHGEIKSMHVAEAHRGTGIARTLVTFVLDTARSRGFKQLSLETGSYQEFLPARRLYARHGFVETGPFEGYVEDPHSTFMTRNLAE